MIRGGEGNLSAHPDSFIRLALAFAHLCYLHLHTWTNTHTHTNTDPHALTHSVICVQMEWLA